jgi:hypothetical protein
MIYGCATEGRYSMKVDLFKPVKVQDEDTGEIVSSWAYVKTISCFAWGVTASGKDLPGTFEYFDKKYAQTDIIRMLTGSEIHKDWRAMSIRNDDSIIWVEDTTGQPTLFDARGSVPVVDPFGNVVEYSTMLTRAEVQGGVSI